MGKKIELITPFLLSLIMAIFFYSSQFVSFSSNKELIQSINSIGGMFIGFSGTIIALLTALNSEMLKKLREANYLKHVTSLILENLLSAVLVVIISMAFLAKPPNIFWQSILILIASHCLFSFARNIFVVYLLINTDPDIL